MLISKSFGECISGTGTLPVSDQVESLKKHTDWKFGPLLPASSVAWSMRGASLLLLSLGGLAMMSDLNHQPPLFISLPLLVLFWIGWITLLVSLLCWVCFRKFPVVTKNVDERAHPRR